MKNSLQEEEEEDRIGSKKHGGKTNYNRGPSENRICNPEVAETTQATEVTDTVMWGSISLQIMGMAPEIEKEALVPEDT